MSGLWVSSGARTPSVRSKRAMPAESPGGSRPSPWRRSSDAKARRSSGRDTATRISPKGRMFAERLQLVQTPRAEIAGLSLNGPLIMGIVNVTPDSFSDGGECASPEEAIAHGRKLALEGARYHRYRRGVHAARLRRRAGGGGAVAGRACRAKLWPRPATSSPSTRARLRSWARRQGQGHR